MSGEAPQIGGDVGKYWGQATADTRDSGHAKIGGDVGRAWGSFTNTVTHPLDNPFATIGAIYGGAGAGLFGFLAGGAAGGQVDQATKPKDYVPQTAPAPPTLGQTNMIALQGQLSQEQRMAASNTILTGGGGLLSEPTTASRVLLGS